MAHNYVIPSLIIGFASSNLLAGEGRGSQTAALTYTQANRDGQAVVPQSDDNASTGEMTDPGGSETFPCSTCAGKCCSCKKYLALNKAVAGSHKPLFYDNNFAYICDPCYDDWWPGDHFKRRPIGEHITFDIGGQYRARLMNERNIRGLGLTGRDDDFLLHRTRLYVNGEFGKRVRLFAEMIDADSNYENFAPRPIEVNRTDMLNLFGDLLLYDDCCGKLWGRVGRQELQYGAQRAISALDWANTRRNFEGYKTFWEGRNWNIDAFYTRPIFPNARQVDSPDYDQEFMGIYSTYKGRESDTFDFYYLVYNNGDANFNFDTVGGRWQGSRNEWLWEFEGAYQYGENSDGSDHAAGFWIAGLGHSFECCPWKPTL